MKVVDFKITPGAGGGSTNTWVVATKESRLYVAFKRGVVLTSFLERDDLSKWTDKNDCIPPLNINPANLYPAAKASYHRFHPRKGEDSSKVFKKHHSALDVASDHNGLFLLQRDRTALITKREVETCESLRDHPHDNVAEYRGVECSDILGYKHWSEPIDIRLDIVRVIKIVFKRYDCTLWDLVTDRQAVNVKQCLNSIAAGIKHLHSLGIVHSDIKPMNVFVSREEGIDPQQSLRYVVGDFDSCQRVGEKIGLKGGDMMWTKKKWEGDVAEMEDDWYAFRKLEAWLVTELARR